MSTNPAQIYQDEFVKVLFEPWSSALIDATRLAQGNAVLDIACGTGAVTRAAAGRVGHGGYVVGLDVSSAMLAVAGTVPAPVGRSIGWVQGSALSLPFTNDVFDAVACQHGFQFFPDKQTAAAEMHRVLCNNGRLGIALWDALERNPVFLAMDNVSIRRLGKSMFSLPFSYSDRETIRRVLDDAGFRNIAVDSCSRNLEAESGERYLRANIRGAAAVLPDLVGMSADALNELVAVMLADMGELIDEHTENGRFVFETNALLVTANK